MAILYHNNPISENEACSAYLYTLFTKKLPIPHMTVCDLNMMNQIVSRRFSTDPEGILPDDDRLFIRTAGKRKSPENVLKDV